MTAAKKYLDTAYIFPASKEGALTYEQIDFFNDQGYLVIEDYIPAQECDKLISRIQELQSNFVQQNTTTTIFSTRNHQHAKDRYFLDSARDIHFFFEEHAFSIDGNLCVELDKALNKVGHALHDLDPVFKRFSYQQSLRNTLHDLGYKQPQWVQSMYIFKQPRIGGAVDYHQDGTFLYSEPQPPIGFWVALQDATVDNGCLWLLPGEHRQQLRQRFKRLGDTLGFETYNNQTWLQEQGIPAPVKKGSLVVLHGHLPHGSFPNHSEKSRHAYTLHAVDKQSLYSPDNWLQPTISRPFCDFESI